MRRGLEGGEEKGKSGTDRKGKGSDAIQVTGKKERESKCGDGGEEGEDVKRKGEEEER